MRAKLLLTLALALLVSAGCANTTSTGTGQISTPSPAHVLAPSSPAPPQTPPAAPAPIPTTSSPVAAPPTAPLDPTAVVEAFYAAINAGDYGTAWQLGGDNLGESYAAFTIGFSDTLTDQLTVTGASGDTVDVDLVAQHTDGTQHEYVGDYTVNHGAITHGTLREITAAAPQAPSTNGVPHALCADGTISYSQHDEGTCSHHGGVAHWYWH